jgi:hypothetical protein
MKSYTNSKIEKSHIAQEIHLEWEVHCLIKLPFDGFCIQRRVMQDQVELRPL